MSTFDPMAAAIDWLDATFNNWLLRSRRRSWMRMRWGEGSPRARCYFRLLAQTLRRLSRGRAGRLASQMAMQSLFGIEFPRGRFGPP